MPWSGGVFGGVIKADRSPVHGVRVEELSGSALSMRCGSSLTIACSETERRQKTHEVNGFKGI